MRVLVTGAGGMLGKDIVDVFTAAGHEILATDRNELDITDQEAVSEYVQTHKPDLIINTAAYNLVDRVEEVEIYPVAYAVNALGPENLAKAAKQAGISFVHYSTDYVFAGDKPEGYVETDKRDPISAYGRTKAAGEELVEAVGGDYYIVRLSKIFGAPGTTEGSKESFVALMLRLAKEKPELSIVDEEVGTPGYTPDIAAATLQLVEGDYDHGIYHFVNAGGGLTWYAFAKEIFDLAGVTTPYHPVPSSQFPKPAKRPAFAELKSTAFPSLRPRTEALKEFLAGNL